MKSKKNLLIAVILVIAVLAVLYFTGVFGGKKSNELTIIATPNPHAEILKLVQDDLAKEGFTLKLTTVTDYVAENPSTAAGDTMANFFQHIPYLDQYNATAAEKDRLVYVVPTHFEPLGLYAGTKSALEDVAEGDKIVVPNDPTNMTRAFILLADAGLIELPEGTTLTSTVTKNDVINPKGLVFVDVNAELAPGMREDAAFVVINGNNASLVGLNPNNDAVYFEQPGSQAAAAYVNVFAVKPENKDADFVKALEKVVYTQKVYDLIVASGFTPVFEVK
ncbi:MAG: MetQ/NlpA family ABC transporter substrate-binding protein [Clostridia bacterium]|nr:MetQ/NlpA family ABC transporter substrate-binding protein [Clostridia bacterium]